MMRLRCISGLLLASFGAVAQAQSGINTPHALHLSGHAALPAAGAPAPAPAAGGGAPVNDFCSSVTPEALAIGGTLTFNGTTTGATITDDYAPGSPLEGFNAPAVWHAFTTTECADVRLEYCGTPSIFSDYWNVFTLDCPALNFVVANSYNTTDCSDGNPTVYFNSLPAGTYYYPVWANDVTAAGPYVLTITAGACSGGPVVPVNDDCASVTPEALVVDGALTFTGDNTGATAAGDFAPGSPFLGDAVVWHAFTTSACADVVVSYCGQAPVWGHTLGILSTDCPADSVILHTAFDNDSCGDGNVTYRFTELAAGTYYLPVLHDPSQSAAGPYTIEVNAVACGGSPVVPVNDACDSMTPEALVMGGTLTFTGDNTGATAAGDFAPGSPFLGDAVVWHAFTTSACADVAVSYCGQAPVWGHTLGILSTDCPADSVILHTAFDNDSCGDGNVTYRFTELAAGIYYLPVLW
ncbi:MAG: hypothetical protein JST66_05855, partial [Bacteroidetes bacterium]|nr:hypothetical protein [Bacteroidota bacterium]